MRTGYDKHYYAKHAEVIKQRARDWYKRNRVQVQRRAQLKRYGLTQEEFDAIWQRQQNRCAICQQLLRVPYVDHDHASGKVRGFLCSGCNCMLGFLEKAGGLGVLKTVEQYLSVAQC